jgi:hypothetical protein
VLAQVSAASPASAMALRSVNGDSRMKIGGSVKLLQREGRAMHLRRHAGSCEQPKAFWCPRS